MLQRDHQTGVCYILFYEQLHQQITISPGREFMSFRFVPFYLDAFRSLVLCRSAEELAQQSGFLGSAVGTILIWLAAKSYQAAPPNPCKDILGEAFSDPGFPSPP